MMDEGCGMWDEEIVGDWGLRNLGIAGRDRCSREAMGLHAWERLPAAMNLTENALTTDPYVITMCSRL
jgi:hypothetical protein